MEILQLRYFSDAAETENFSTTAKKFRVPASNISQSVHRLETELGTALFDRTANRVRLNKQGREFRNDINKALAFIDNAKQKLAKQDKISGELKILIETNRRVVASAIEVFREKYNSVTFFINHSADDTVEYDLIISDRNFIRKNMTKELFVAEDILLAAAKDNPLALKKNLALTDLKNERFITLNDRRGLYNLTKQICREAGFDPNIVIQSDDPHYIRKYVEMGLGLSFIPSFSWKGLFSDNAVLLNICSAKRYTYVYKNTYGYMSREAEMFLDILFGLLKNNN